MGKRGPKRKEGKREASGRLDRASSMDRLNAMNREQSRAVKAIVLAQPHRRGLDDEWLALAAGRFCRAQGLAKEVHAACDTYLATDRRWAAGYGAPRGYEQHHGGSGKGPSESQMKEWRETLNKIEFTVRRVYGFDVFSAMRRMIVENMDYVGDPRPMISAVCEMAVLTNFIDRNPHPFRG